MERKCVMCPRSCAVNRNEQAGFCGAKSSIEISKVMFHHWEEPCISGDKGSGAIFFTHCSLKCVYCQNQEISHAQSEGRVVNEQGLVEIMKDLENQNVHNINFVTPTHYTEQIIKALRIYKPQVPVVWNTSGYESVETIKKLDGLVDVFLTDFKYYDEKLSEKYSACKDYPEQCKKAILQMRKHLPEDIFENGLMKKGIIIRHLVLPTHTDDSKRILEWINDKLGDNAWVSLMSQYTPCGDLKLCPELSRKLKPLEYKMVCRELERLGFLNGYVQELCSATTQFIPEFRKNENA